MVSPPASPGAGVRTHRAAAVSVVEVGAAVAAGETGSDQPVGDQAAATRVAAVFVMIGFFSKKVW